MTNDEMLAFVKQKQTELKVETITNITNNTNTIDTTDTIDMASFYLVEDKPAIPCRASHPAGHQTSSEEVKEGQEAEGVLGSPKPKTLADEKKILIENDRWITATGIDYVKVDFWLDTPNDPLSIKLRYSFKRTGRNDLSYNRYSLKLTQNRYDYIRNIEQRWADIKTQAPYYHATAQEMRQQQKLGIPYLAGKAQTTRRYNAGIKKIPLEPFTTTSLTLNNDNDFVLHIQHHDFKLTLEYPMEQWQEQCRDWINEWATRVEQKQNKPRNVPPFVTMQWREYL